MVMAKLMVLVALLSVVFLSQRTSAASPEDEAAIAWSAIKVADESYRSGGMEELNVDVADCYVQARELIALSTTEFCYVLDVFAFSIEGVFARSLGFVPDPFNSEAAMNKRVDGLFDLLRTGPAMRKTKKATWKALAFKAVGRLKRSL